MKKFIFIVIITTTYEASSTPTLSPGYLGDGVSPAWAVSAQKWSVSIDDISSNRLLTPVLHATCYVKKKKPDFCFSSDYDLNPGHAACMDIVSPGLSLWFSFKAHPNDPKPAFIYSFTGLFKLVFFPTFINRPVKISTGSDLSFPGRFVRYAVSDLVNENYQAVFKHSQKRQWLYEFAHLKQKHLYISGEGIKIKAIFWHQDLDKWTMETLDKCP